jgi:chromosome partitioning protein
MRSIAVFDQQGGAGKTTTAVNLGHALAMRGRRVVLVDLDPRGHLTSSLGIFRAPRHGVDQVLLRQAPLLAHAIDTRELLQLLPAGQELAAVEKLDGGVERGARLRDALRDCDRDIDYLVFDCPPSAGLLMANAILAVDEVLAPVAGDYLSLTAIAKLMVTLKRFEAWREQPLRLRLFLSRFMPRRRLSQEVQRKLLHHFPGQLLATAIREAAVVAEAAAAGRTVFEYRGHSKSAVEFRCLCGDLLEGRMLVHEQVRARDVA